MHPFKSHRVVCQAGVMLSLSDSQSRAAFESAQNEGWPATRPTLHGALWLGHRDATGPLRADVVNLRTHAETIPGD